MSDLKDLYHILSCDTVEHTYRNVSGRTFEIWCDEEGLCKRNPRISAIDDELNAALVGSLVLFRGDGSDVTDEDISFLKCNIGYLVQSGDKRILDLTCPQYAEKRVKAPKDEMVSIFMPNDFDERAEHLRFFSRETSEVKPELYFTADTRALSEVVADSSFGIANAIYETYNIEHPIGYRNRSVSVGDVIAYTKNGVTKVLYVDIVGFRNITDSFKLDHSDVEITPCLLRVG